MIYRQIDTRRQCSRPVPLSFLIDTASHFHCDIYIDCDGQSVNVKNYDEMLRNLHPRNGSLIFFFNGNDERDAQKTIERIFQD